MRTKMSTKMSTKENWDDSSDEEGDEEEGCFACPPDPLYEAKEEAYHEAQFIEESNENDYTTADEEEADPIDNEEVAIETEEHYDEWGVEEVEDPQDDDDDYDDELDNYDKKLGRYLKL